MEQPIREIIQQAIRETSNSNQIRNIIQDAIQETFNELRRSNEIRDRGIKREFQNIHEQVFSYSADNGSSLYISQLPTWISGCQVIELKDCVPGSKGLPINSIQYIFKMHSSSHVFSLNRAEAILRSR